MKARQRIVNRLLPFIAFLLLGAAPTDAAAPGEEDTYEITLVKSAEAPGEDRGGREILRVGGRRVLAERHKVREGEWIWKILREKADPEQKNLHRLLGVLKRLNPHLDDLDRIHPGETILVPLRLAPAGLEGARAEVVQAAPDELEEIELERYTVSPGDSLIRILNKKYDIPRDASYEGYLKAVQRLNPSIKDPDIIHPGQVIRLPIHSPDLVRMPIEEAPPRPEPGEADAAEEVEFTPPPAGAVQIRPTREEADPLRDELGRIFRLLGAGWIDRGRHYIPLKDRGGADLRADSHPMIDLAGGLKVIVDLNHSMPGAMATLIETTWDHYRVVHLDPDQGLEAALEKILPECDMGILHRRGEAYHLGGAIPVRLSADWIIERTAGRPGPEVVMLTLLEPGDPPTPGIIRSYLEGRGVKVLDYPPDRGDAPDPPPPLPPLEPAGGIRGVLDSLAELSGASLKAGVEIPVYDGRDQDFNLYVRADCLLERGDTRLVVDLTGLGREVVSLMEKRGITCIFLGGEGDPLEAAARVLRSLGVPFDPGPLEISACGRDEQRDIRIRIPGVAFEDRTGQKILAAAMLPPQEILSLLAREGYRVLKLPTL